MTNEWSTPEDERSWVPEDDELELPGAVTLPEVKPSEGSEGDVIEQRLDVPAHDDEAPR
jgi:hypothetical protein